MGRQDLYKHSTAQHSTAQHSTTQSAWVNPGS